MPASQRATATTSPTSPDGVISGALLREIRRRLGLKQEEISELLGVDVDTYRSWEHGRRPLGKVQVHTMRILTQGLLRVGADSQLVDLLDTAVSVDLSITEVLRAPMPVDRHPLGNLVQTRVWHDLLAWGISGAVPRALRNGTNIPRPRLAVPTRDALLERLRNAAEQTDSRTDATATLLRRQVYFVASWDDSGPGRDWVARMGRHELGRLRAVDGWTPTWVAGRSLAVAQAVSGDPEQLRHFISRQLAGDDQEIANLNYWANWSGEDTTPALSDEFMKTPDLPRRWRGTELLRQLTAGLNPPSAYVDLTVHTIWALLERRPLLLEDDPTLTAALHANAGLLLDDSQTLSDQARQELGEINYLTKTKLRRSA